MEEFVIDIKNLVVKHWGKLIIVYLISSLILNFDDVINGWKEGMKEVNSHDHAE